MIGDRASAKKPDANPDQSDEYGEHSRANRAVNGSAKALSAPNVSRLVTATGPVWS